MLQNHAISERRMKENLVEMSKCEGAMVASHKHTKQEGKSGPILPGPQWHQMGRFIADAISTTRILQRDR